MKAIVPFRPDVVRMLLLLTKGLKPEILRLVLRSTHGTCKLLTEDLFSLPIPFPPLGEQHRIVAKVGELMALCDQLEAELISAQANGGRLLEAVLHEAFANDYLSNDDPNCLTSTTFSGQRQLLLPPALTRDFCYRRGVVAS